MIFDTTRYRVIYGDTDQMGVVYYGNYARFFEIGRTELFRNIGISYKKVEESGLVMPVVSMNLKYYKSAYYDDILDIKTMIKTMPTSRITLFHEIYNEKKELLVKGNATLCFIDIHRKRPIKAPQMLIEKISKVKKV